MSVQNIASVIDHTLLRQDATLPEMQQALMDARELHCAAVCVPPTFVKALGSIARSEGSPAVAAVIGFPFGYQIAEVKGYEAQLALEQGATELDMVANIGAIRMGAWTQLEHEAALVLKHVRTHGGLLKVIVESGILTDEELIACCNCYAQLGVDFVKTSTGFASQGASVHAVRLMRAHLPQNIRIKASGGIRSYAFAKELIDAGASRLGCSATRTIVAEEAAAKLP